MALVQISYKFNLNASAAYPSFTLDPQIDHTADKNHLRMSICTG
jgi:CD109 antigen